MWDAMFQYVVPAALGAAAGTLASLGAPWAHWGVEKKRLKLQHRRQLVESWRAMIGDFIINRTREGDDFRAFLERSGGFYSLKPHLSEHFKRMLYAPRTAYVPADGATIGVLEDRIIDEIARIEKEWRLT